MDFRVRGLAPGPFRRLFDLSDAALAASGARRFTADAKPGFPDRIGLREAEVGETVILANYEHLPKGPYRSSYAVFVAEGSTQRFDAVGEVPEILRSRPLSLRAFDADLLLVDAALAGPEDLRGAIDALLCAPRTAFVHAHFARPGCYAALIERA